MTNEQLAAIRERAEAASDGKWVAERQHFGPAVATGAAMWRGDVEYAVWDCDDPQDGCIGSQQQWMADAQFIAHARQDIPALLAENAALREIVEAVANIPNSQRHMALGDWAVCPFECGAERSGYWYGPTLHHTADCPISKARALVEKSREEVQ